MKKKKQVDLWKYEFDYVGMLKLITFFLAFLVYQVSNPRRKFNNVYWNIPTQVKILD